MGGINFQGLEELQKSFKEPIEDSKHFELTKAALTGLLSNPQLTHMHNADICKKAIELAGISMAMLNKANGSK